MLPHEFPPWKTVYHYFRLWRLKGIWEHINTVLRTELRIANGREPEPRAAILDIQSVKTTETPGVRGYDAGKKVKGRTRHILVDTTGLMLMVIVHAANIQVEMVLNLFWKQLRGDFLDWNLFGLMLVILVNWLIGSK